MRKLFNVALLLGISYTSLAQSENVFSKFYHNQVKPSSKAKKLQLFAELNPQFFAFGGYGFGVGAEFSRFQVGYIGLKTKLTPTFRDAIFDNATNLEIPKNTAKELFLNVFLRKDRKGFYAGSILSFDDYKVIDISSQKSEEFKKQYVVTRAGFRWFPFKETFYIDGGYGVSFNLNRGGERTIGNTTYSAKSILTLPFFAVGGRISLNKN